jgi:hypothetical protein
VAEIPHCWAGDVLDLTIRKGFFRFADAITPRVDVPFPDVCAAADRPLPGRAGVILVRGIVRISLDQTQVIKVSTIR